MTYTYPTVTTIDTFYTTADGTLITPEKLEYLIYIELSTIDVIKKLTTNGSTVSTVLLKFAVFAELFPL